MTDADRPGAGTGFAKGHRRTVGVRFGPLAAELVQTAANPVHFVSELCCKPAGVKMRAPFAVLVDASAVCEFRPSQLIQFGQFLEGDIMQYRGEQVVGVRRAAGYGDDRFAGQNFGDALASGGIRCCSGNAPP